MKKESIVIVIAIVTACLLIIGALFATNCDNTPSQETSSNSGYKKETNLNQKLEIVKSIANSTIYFPYEKNGKSYILFGYCISSYSDPNKSTMTLNDVRYENDSLIVDIYVQEEPKTYDVPEGTIIDDYSINILWETIETKNNYSTVYVSATNPNKVGTDYREISRFNGGVVKKNNKCGYVDENADLCIPYIYEGIYELSVDNYDLRDPSGNKLNLDYSNYVRINDENGNGIATKQGDVLMECQYGRIGYYGENTFFVTKGDKLDKWQTGVVDINNNIIIDFIDGYIERPETFLTSSPFAEYSVFKDNKEYCGIIDRDFNIVVYPIYSDAVMSCKDSRESRKESYYFIVEKDNQHAILDYQGRLEVDFCDKTIYEISNEYEGHAF